MQPFERLKVIREQLGKSLPDFSAELGYSNAGSYRNLESGLDPISKILLKRLHEKFGVNPNYLLRGEGEMFNKDNQIFKTNNYTTIETMDYKDKYIEALEEISRLKSKLLEVKDPGEVRGEAV